LKSINYIVHVSTAEVRGGHALKQSKHRVLCEGRMS